MLCWMMGLARCESLHKTFEKCCVFLTDVSRKEAVQHRLAGLGKRQAQSAFEP
jgi:hypothetical protein